MPGYLGKKEEWNDPSTRRGVPGSRLTECNAFSDEAEIHSKVLMEALMHDFSHLMHNLLAGFGAADFAED